MGMFKKFVVCLPLLLTLLLAMAAGLAAGLLARPCPALAVWGDNNEPMPVVLGLELGSDIRGYPGGERLSPGGGYIPDDWCKGATYGGIPAEPNLYRTCEYKIASVSFFIKPKDFPRFRRLMRREFGNEILRNEENRNWVLEEGYHWGKYEIEVCAAFSFAAGGVSIKFTYLPLYNRYLDAGDPGVPDSFAYHGVTLGQKAEDYPFLRPIKEEAPDIVYYQSTEPPLVFDYRDKTIGVESETWVAYKGVIYSLELRGDNADDHFLVWELKDIYKISGDNAASIELAHELRLIDYTIYFEPGLTITTHMPTYWAMLRAKTKLGK